MTLQSSRARIVGFGIEDTKKSTKILQKNITAPLLGE